MQLVLLVDRGAAAARGRLVRRKQTIRKKGRYPSGGEMTTLTVVFDGEALRPDGPVDLIPNRRYRVHLVPADESGAGENESAWDVLERLEGTVEAPTDWSVEHDHYLYGGQKASNARPVGGSHNKA